MTWQEALGASLYFILVLALTSLGMSLCFHLFSTSEDEEMP